MIDDFHFYISAMKFFKRAFERMLYNLRKTLLKL